MNRTIQNQGGSTMGVQNKGKHSRPRPRTIMLMTLLAAVLFGLPDVGPIDNIFLEETAA